MRPKQSESVRTQSAFRGADVELVELDQDHPGFNDALYRRRRNQIAALARNYVAGGELPLVRYVESEQGVWQTVCSELGPAHEQHACREYLEGLELFAFDPDHIPDFGTVNDRLRPLQGFSLAPVAGLVMPAAFLEQLAERRFLATQYMRHPSEPLYTPEPDVIHEYIGHVPTLAHPRFAALNLAFGRAAIRARGNPSRIEALIRLYWYTLEFGVVQEGDELKVYGAGILSSLGELGRYHNATLRPWDLDSIARTPYDPTTYQAQLYVAPSFDEMSAELCAYLG